MKIHVRFSFVQFIHPHAFPTKTTNPFAVSLAIKTATHNCLFLTENKAKKREPDNQSWYPLEHLGPYYLPSSRCSKWQLPRISRNLPTNTIPSDSQPPARWQNCGGGVLYLVNSPPHPTNFPSSGMYSVYNLLISATCPLHSFTPFSVNRIRINYRHTSNMTRTVCGILGVHVTYAREVYGVKGYP